MRLHEGAVRAAAVVIKSKRYLLCSVTDEELVREAVTAYNEAKPNRSRRPKPEGTEPERQAAGGMGGAR